MIVIYTPKVTNRIKYVFDFVFVQYFGMTYFVTENKDESINEDDILLVYAGINPVSGFSIFQDNLLLEETIAEQRIYVSRENNLPVFFQTDEHFNISFDIFSCIFYLITRYEEYLPHTTDAHGRYLSSNSILAKKEFSFRPIVEEWLYYFKKELIRHFPQLKFKEHVFQYRPTFDIDNAYRFSGRNWLKHPPNIFAKGALAVLFQKKQDPYDVYDFIFRELELYDLHPIFFFLLNDEGVNDSKVSPSSKKLHDLIQKISSVNYETGIHPAYNALKEQTLIQEAERLTSITGKKTGAARQHFLNIRFPDYYKALVNTEITDDYSIAYADVIGCRAGTTQAFPFYNLSENKAYHLLIHPAVWMDATFAYYQTEKKNEQIMKDFSDFVLHLRKINGRLVTIYHNDLLATDKYRYLFQTINQQVNKF